MEDFCYAGGVPAVLKELGDHIKSDCITISGHSIGDEISKAEILNTEVIRELSTPLQQQAGIAVLYGNLAPGGAIIKPAAKILLV